MSVGTRNLRPRYLARHAAPSRVVKRRTEHEDIEQANLFRWLRLVAKWNGRPLDYYAWHTPNGGVRSARQAGRFKLMGVKAGVPDVQLAVARGGFHGLFVEMKYGDNDTTAKQDDVIAMLREQGYRCEVAWSWREAAGIINDYLGTRFSVE